MKFNYLHLFITSRVIAGSRCQGFTYFPISHRLHKKCGKLQYQINDEENQYLTKESISINIRRKKDDSNYEEHCNNLSEVRTALFKMGKKLNGINLSDLNKSCTKSEKTLSEQRNHEVLRLIERRAKSQSKPLNRSPNDRAKIALSIEGGGE
mmetsp:Transcript_40316/g.94725  ORF Transcript_40316/g.94725 Transcript_40316/m.94725 type:complete len:152 (-) Transcript_40316:282-737(-)